MQTTLKKRIRLKNFNYLGTYRYSITICTYNKKKIFTDKELVSWLVKSLEEKAKLLNFKVWAWCLMPDHLHLLVEGSNSDSNLKKFISSYKQQTSFEFKKKMNQRLWQINFYDHVLRTEEDTIAVANYIFNNPVRAGLANNYKDYYQLGSFEFDVMNDT